MSHPHGTAFYFRLMESLYHPCQMPPEAPGYMDKEFCPVCRAGKPIGEELLKPYLEHLFVVPSHVTLGALEFGSWENVPERKEWPVLRTPFFLHSELKTLHTICRRESDIIDQLEM